MTIPIELKSGRGDRLIMNHRIQTQLYGMVHALRNQNKFHEQTALVSYIKTGNIFSIPIKQIEIDQILEKRNTVSGYFRRAFDKKSSNIRKLPPLIENSHECERCFKRTMCAFWAKEEKIQHVDPKVQKIFDDDTKHLTPDTIDFVLKWTKLGLLEQKHINKRHRGEEIWNPESNTNCIRDLKPFGKAQAINGQFKIIFKLPFQTDWPFSQDCGVWLSTKERPARIKAFVNRITPSKGAAGRGQGCVKIYKIFFYFRKQNISFLSDFYSRD